MADQWHPRWLGILGNANLYNFHSSAVMGNRALLQRLETVPCEVKCIAAVRKASERLERCIAHGMLRADYATPCVVRESDFSQ